MTVMFDLGQATSRLSRLVSAVQDEQLELATPCHEWTVADLLAHIHQFTAVFTTNAAKLPPNPPTTLVAAWRTQIPAALDELADGWRNESAWDGTVSAGGVEMSAADNALVAAEELTVHAWDLARATGQRLSVDDSDLDHIDAFLGLFGGAPFGPRVELVNDADRLDTTLARTGRDPQWAPPG